MVENVSCGVLRFFFSYPVGASTVWVGHVLLSQDNDLPGLACLLTEQMS